MKQVDIVCGALVDHGKVMIARRDHGSAKGSFEFPGGKVEANESLEQAIRREFMEELEIEVDDVLPLASSQDFQEGCLLNVHAFILSCHNRPQKSNDHDMLVWTTPDHIYDYAFFEADRPLVQALKEKWNSLENAMSKKS
jgi:8-oxo-dGTP diphosphatase